MKQKLIVIGGKEKIDLPEYDMESIVAKVDTGADSSSIWVSDLKSSKAGLEFYFFGPDSPFFVDKKVQVKSYEQAVIINSFGQKELRYKIKLRIRLRGRLIRATFTLSDRSLMTYPILLGRRLLRDKFLVDVSQGHNLKLTAESKKKEAL